MLCYVRVIVNGFLQIVRGDIDEQLVLYFVRNNLGSAFYLHWRASNLPNAWINLSKSPEYTSNIKGNTKRQ